MRAAQLFFPFVPTCLRAFVPFFLLAPGFWLLASLRVMVDDLVKYLHTPHWGRQGRWRRAVWKTFARMGLTGVHALPVHRRWIEIHRRAMPLESLDDAMAGLKLVQLSDLHYSPVVWRSYL